MQQPYKTTDYSKLSVDDALTKLLMARKTVPSIPTNKQVIKPNVLNNTNVNTNDTILQSNKKTDIDFYDMDTKIKEIVNNKQENKETNDKFTKNTNETKLNETKTENKFIENIKLKIEKRKKTLVTQIN